LERFGLAEAGERVSHDRFHQIECLESDSTVGFHPIAQVLDELRLEDGDPLRLGAALALILFRQGPAPDATPPRFSAGFFPIAPVPTRQGAARRSSASGANGRFRGGWITPPPKRTPHPSPRG